MLCGGADDWLFSTVVGLQPLAPGWARVEIAPHVASDGTGPASANASITTMAGLVRVAWQTSLPGSHGIIAIQASHGVPAALSIPTLGHAADSVVIREGGRAVLSGGHFVPGVEGISHAEVRSEAVVLTCASGEYAFEVHR